MYRYNQKKRSVYTLCLIQEKITPFPNAMLIRVMLSEALPDPPTLIDRVGKDYDKSEILCSLLNNVMYLNFSGIA